MATIIVPAHNESSVIRACLDSIIHQDHVDQVIVACNGCTDDTANKVQTYYPDVICLDIAKASKTNALNEAEKFITSYPVFYLDADTALDPQAISTITAHLQKNDLLLAAPTPNIDVSESSWVVRQYYKIWLQLPYIKDGVIGTCSFIISEAGRKRFNTFPDIINDDGFVRCCFDSHERGNIKGTSIFIKAPKTVYSLIKIKTRARLGNMQLTASNLCARPKQANYSASLKEKILSRNCIAAFVYIGIALIIRVRAKKQYRKLDSYVWEKDFSSR